MTTFCIAFYESYLSTVSQIFTGMGGGGGHYTDAKCIPYMCENLVDWKLIAHFVCSQVTELTLKMRLLKNFSSKRGSFGQFLIRIRIEDTRIRIQIRDSNPDSNPDLDPDSNPDPDSKLTAGRIRIRNWIRNFCFGSATLKKILGSGINIPDTQYWANSFEQFLIFLHMFFWRVRVCWPLLCLCRDILNFWEMSGFEPQRAAA